MSEESDEDWTDDQEDVLRAIQSNSMKLMAEHKRRHFVLKDYLMYFRIPTIIISAINSVFSVGLQPYMEQGLISVINCLLSLVAGIIVSIELFIGVEKQCSAELISSKEYYILGANIQKILKLERKNRQCCGRIFLDDSYSEYCKLYEKSCLLSKRISDTLIEPADAKSTAPSPSGSDYSFGITINEFSEKLDKLGPPSTKSQSNV